VPVADNDPAQGDVRAFAPVARSPINVPGPRELQGGWEVSTRSSSAPLTLGDASAVTKMLVRADPDGAVASALPPRGQADRAGDVLRVGSGPGEWLLLSSGQSPHAVANPIWAVTDAGLVSVVDLTHGRALVRLSGADAARALAKVCAVDLSDTKAPDGTAFRSSVASLTTDVVRDDRGGARSYLLHCERSSGQFLFEALLEAGDEFGVEPVGLAGDEI
jgi:heterotetrameric sarcosine oxidase gamma subunit